MFTALRKMTQNVLVGRSAHTGASYEEAIKALCLTLQSNAAYLQSIQKHVANDPGKLKDTEKYLLRSGVTLEQLDTLSVIHVAGTKGKGSTCAFAEAVLRQYGFSTGFFSSPHLVSVRERIRVNGEPISRTNFARAFWNVYRRLEQKREHDSDMPTYFKFLTILMFHVFLEANVDVAIVEVGIGGELDCTNILRNPVCVGVTSLGLEHTSLLGDTLEEIAHQKSGIFKRHAAAFTVPQPDSAMRVLRRRAVEKQCRGLRIVPAIPDREWSGILSSAAGIRDFSDVQRQNALLSIRMALEWMKLRREKGPLLNADDKCIDTSRYDPQSDNNNLCEITYPMEKTVAALANCKWPGRMQILRTSVADFFLDGAHTVESILHCVSWFQRTSRGAPVKFLLFNTSGNRNSVELLELLRPLGFDRAYFAPNIPGVANIEDLSNFAVTDDQKKKCREHCELWGSGSVLKDNVAEVLVDVKRYASSRATGDDKVKVLVTGSLHLVGALLTTLDPDLTMTSNF